MSADKLANRYATALLQEAQSSGTLDVVLADLQLLSNTLQQNAALVSMYKNPIISGAKKLAVTQQAFAGKINALTGRFVELLINKGREAYIAQVIAQFIKQYNSLKGISEAVVTTAVELDAASEEKIKHYIRQTTGLEQVTIKKKVDSSILGGFVIDFGDKVYNASVKYKLHQLSNELSLN